MLSDDVQRGRYLLFEKVTDEASVEALSEQEYRDIHRAVGVFNALAFYLERGFLNKADVMDMWAQSIYRTLHAAQPLIDHRLHRTGYKPWPHLEQLANRTNTYLAREGAPTLVFWRRSAAGAALIATLEQEVNVAVQEPPSVTAVSPDSPSSHHM
jgi:hypothetical protein